MQRGIIIDRSYFREADVRPGILRLLSWELLSSEDADVDATFDEI